MALGDVVVHAFTDGRDTSPSAGWHFVQEVESWGTCRVGTVMGRYFAMDRDQPRGAHAEGARRAGLGPGRAHGRVGRGGGPRGLRARRVGRVHRADARRRGGAHRAGGQRRLLQLPARPDAPARPGPRRRGHADHDADRVRRGLRLPGRLPAGAARDRRCRSVIEAAGGRQLHVAETEKYPHVTYFFGGGEEEPCEGERRELVPSPRDVPTYDHKPEMSAARGGRRVRRRLGARTSRASGSSTSPTPTWSATPASIPAAVTAIETVDTVPGRGRRGRAGDRRRADHHRRPRQRRRDARGRRLARHRALAQPGPAGRSPRRGWSCTTAASWPTSRRPSWRCSASSSRPR